LIYHEEAKAKEIGFSVGAGSMRDLFSDSVLVTEYCRVGQAIEPGNRHLPQRSLKGELLYIDPWLFESI
jgi:hypothetical protein